MSEVKRVQYFDHQFLRLGEFEDEQDYHRRLRQVHNATLHTAGIASGLDVTVDQGSSHVTVAAGAAIDASGHDLVLDAAQQVELGGLAADQDAFVVISWQQESTDPSPDGGGDTRWTEAPKLEGMTAAPTDGDHLVLGRVKRQGTTVQPNPDLSGRRAAGVAAGDLSANSLHLRAANVVPSSWPTFTAPGANAARLDGSLTVSGAIAGGGALTVTGAFTAASAQLSGALAIDTANGNGGAKDPGLMFGSASGEGIASTRGAGTNRFGLDLFTNSTARLSIDNAGHVGIGTRTPQVALDVNGPLRVANGTITPAIGNSAAAGIYFPINPGGGAGDEAFMRYYVETAGTETTTFLIGDNNDADDRLELWQAGAQRLSIYNGCVGLGTRTPTQRLDVAGWIAINGKEALRGDDAWLRLNQSLVFTSGVHTPGNFAPDRCNVGGANGWGDPGTGNMWVRLNTEMYGTLVTHGETHLGTDGAATIIGGNQTGLFMQCHDDLWLSDPQNGTIQLRNSNNTNWGTLVGFFSAQCSRESKTGVRKLKANELSGLLDDALSLDVVRFMYRGEDEETGRERFGVIAEKCPPYLLGVDGKSVNVMEYAALLHGAVQALAAEVAELKGGPVSRPEPALRSAAKPAGRAKKPASRAEKPAASAKKPASRAKKPATRAKKPAAKRSARKPAASRRKGTSS